MRTTGTGSSVCHSATSSTTVLHTGTVGILESQYTCTSTMSCRKIQLLEAGTARSAVLVRSCLQSLYTHMYTNIYIHAYYGTN